MTAPIRTLAWLATCLLACSTALSGPGLPGPIPENNTVLGNPKDVPVVGNSTDWEVVAGEVNDFEWFAPDRVSRYGDGPEMNTGFFFSVDGLAWSIQRPDTTWIGLPADENFRLVTATGGLPITEVQRSTMSTSFIESDFTTGTRFEFGHINRQNGWMGSFYDLQTQDQYTSSNNVGVLFNDPPRPGIAAAANTDPGLPAYLLVSTAGYALPVTFDTLWVENRVHHWSAEMMYLRRFRPTHHNRVFEMMLGARYFELDEVFKVRGVGSVLGPLSINTASESWWNTEADNHVVGPEIGLRMAQKRGRWMLNTEGRFMPAWNMQSYRMHKRLYAGQVAGNPPVTGTLLRAPFSEGGYQFDEATEFMPVVEVRAELRYQITSAISAHFGWNALWMDGVGRAPNVIDYTVPDMGFNMVYNRQSTLVTGFIFGLDINR